MPAESSKTNHLYCQPFITFVHFDRAPSIVIVILLLLAWFLSFISSNFFHKLFIINMRSCGGGSGKSAQMSVSIWWCAIQKWFKFTLSHLFFNSAPFFSDVRGLYNDSVVCYITNAKLDWALFDFSLPEKLVKGNKCKFSIGYLQTTVQLLSPNI